MAWRFRPRHQQMVEQGAERLLAFCHRMAYPAHDRRFPPVLINTLPKSGSKYLMRSMARTLQVDVIRILNGGLTKAGIGEPDFRRFAEGNYVCQEHLPAEPHIVASLEMWTPKMVLHLRDPRAALVSWVHHVNTLYRKGHIVAILQALECRLPEGYIDWPIGDQLAWQVDNFLPKTVSWISLWMDVVDDVSKRLSILVTNHSELATDSRALIARILKFYDIDFEPEWISARAPIVGKWNYRTGLKEDWRETYPAALLDRATSAIFERERNRFGWN